MSTNTHEESKTCTDIVNWLSRATASVERATLAARVAGRTHETAADWLAARANARAAEDEAITLLCQAVPQTGLARHPGAAAAVLTLQTGGWKYKVGHAKWQHPGPGLDAGVLAAEKLRGLGWSWGANLGVWLPPAPSADAQRAQVAEATLGGLGYEWAPKRQAWVCTTPAPAKPDVPQSTRSAEGVLVRMGWRYNGTSNVWEGPRHALPSAWDAEECRNAAQAVISARYQGLLTAQMDQALNLLVDALGGGARPAFPADPVRAAAVRVIRHSGKVDGAALPELEQALNALDKALVADGSLPSAWDAEECRNAALEVLRVASQSSTPPSLWGALGRLGRAVQREQ